MVAGAAGAAGVGAIAGAWTAFGAGVDGAAFGVAPGAGGLGAVPSVGSLTFCGGAPGAPGGGAPGIGCIPPIGGRWGGVGISLTSTSSTSKIRSALGGIPGWAASGPGRPLAPYASCQGMKMRRLPLIFMPS